MKHRIFKRYKTRKRGGQHYWTGRSIKRNFGMTLPPRLTFEEREQMAKEFIETNRRKFVDIKDKDDLTAESRRLAELGEGLDEDFFEGVLDERLSEFEPFEKQVKRKYGEKPTEQNIRAAEMVERLWRPFAGPPEVQEARRAKAIREMQENTEKALLSFEPDKSNKDVWRALVRDPTKLEIWAGDHPKLNPSKIKRIKFYQDGGFGREIWEVIDQDGDGALIEWNPKTRQYSTSSPHFDEVEQNNGG